MSGEMGEVEEEQDVGDEEQPTPLQREAAWDKVVERLGGSWTRIPPPS